MQNRCWRIAVTYVCVCNGIHNLGLGVSIPLNIIMLDRVLQSFFRYCMCDVCKMFWWYHDVSRNCCLWPNICLWTTKWNLWYFSRAFVIVCQMIIVNLVWNAFQQRDQYIYFQKFFLYLDQNKKPNKDLTL